MWRYELNTYFFRVLISLISFVSKLLLSSPPFLLSLTLFWKAKPSACHRKSTTSLLNSFETQGIKNKLAISSKGIKLLFLGDFLFIILCVNTTFGLRWALTFARSQLLVWKLQVVITLELKLIPAWNNNVTLEQLWPVALATRVRLRLC